MATSSAVHAATDEAATARRVAFLLADDFEDKEFSTPYTTLVEHGHDVDVIGIEAGRELTGKRGEVTITTSHAVGDVAVADYDLVVVPGGYSPDKLRVDDGVVAFVREAFLTGTPIGAICHAGSLLIEAGVVDGVRMTSWPSIRTDLRNAGAEWVDEEFVEDDGIMTSRRPDDLPAFVAGLLSRLGDAVEA